MNRTKFYSKVTVDDIEELDFLDNSLSEFTMKRVPSYYRLSVRDRKRPDVTSYLNYQTQYYWWTILLANNILDPFFETTIGRVVAIPSILDLHDFFQRNKRRR